MLPFYRKLEHDVDFGGDVHGKGGPIWIERPKPSNWHPTVSAFYDSCWVTGFAESPDFNEPTMPGEVNMLEQLVETFCAVDDFCQAFLPQGEAYLLRNGTTPRGPELSLSVSEIITILLMLHGSRFKYLKSFYNWGGRRSTAPLFSEYAVL